MRCSSGPTAAITTRRRRRSSLPAFTFEELAGRSAEGASGGAFKSPSGDVPALDIGGGRQEELADLQASIFDATFEPIMTVKTPPPGKDILQASSNTFYQGVSLEDLKDFQERYPLNSRVVKDAAGLREEVYRAGTTGRQGACRSLRDLPAKAIGFLEKARGYAEPAQATVIGDLIRFYQTGDPKDWLQLRRRLGAQRRDGRFRQRLHRGLPRSRAARKARRRASSPITDKPVTNVMVNLAKNAAYFEDKAPWDAEYKKRDFTPPVVKAVEVLIETGDFHVNTIGVNLPNEQEIHAKYGTKNFLLLGSSHALGAAAASSSTSSRRRPRKPRARKRTARKPRTC